MLQTMSTINTTVRTWRTPIIASLLMYATTDETWSRWFEQIIKNQPWFGSASTQQCTAPSHSPWYLPTDDNHAKAGATWLLGSTLRESEQSALAVWAASREVPQDLIFFGVGMGMIIGLTIGDPDMKKKKRAQLSVVIDHATYTTLSKPALSQLVLETALGTIARELRRAGGITKKMHPDSVNWLMEEPATAVYVSDRSVLTSVSETAKHEQLITSRYTPLSRALGISPAINDSFLSSFALNRAE